MTRQRVFIVDYASDARRVPDGRAIAMALPDGADMTIVRGTTRSAWADEALERCTHVILSGSAVPSPRDESWFALACADIRRVIDAGMPTLGICFGHQVIVQALGDPDMVRHAAHAEYGIVQIRPVGGAAGDPVLGTLGAGDYALYNSHFDEVVPERAVDALGLDVFAESDRCAVHAFRVRGRPVWGIQSHPEMTPETMKQVIAEHPPAGDAAGFAPIARDVAGRPSCRCPEVFDAFLRIAPEAARAGDAAAE